MVYKKDRKGRLFKRQKKLINYEELSFIDERAC
jgi:hypothetical protein